MSWLYELWTQAQAALFEGAVQPLLYTLGLMAWAEEAFVGVEVFMLGLVQIAIILLLIRPIENLTPGERWPDRKLTRVDVVYTLLNKLGLLPLAVFLLMVPVIDTLNDVVREYDLILPQLEQLVPWLDRNPVPLFVAYFLIYDLAGYWLHRMQHRFTWWWALHSIHHSQRQMSCWTDDRNHVLDDLLVAVYFAVITQLVGVQPEQYVGLLLVGKLVESFSHLNVPWGFGRIGDRMLVSPRFHRLHHARGTADDPRIHDHNYGAVFPWWDMIFRTARLDEPMRPTGVPDSEVDADNGKGWLAQQWAGLRRMTLTLIGREKQAFGVSTRVE